MSELITIDGNRRNLKERLLITSSALSLVGFIALIDIANAAENDRPTAWIELGGQLEMLQGTSSPIVAPFMAVSPTPAPYLAVPFIDSQRPADHAFGLEGKLTFQPKNSDWVFSASVRYGRSHAKRHLHHTNTVIVSQHTSYGTPTHPAKHNPFADSRTRSDESHAVIDFSVGRDVGLGLFGRDSTSTLNAGVRFAQFSTKSS